MTSRRRHPTSAATRLQLALALALLLPGCAPRVQVEAPKDPIRIDVNVKIEQEVRIKVEKDVEQLIEDEDLY